MFIQMDTKEFFRRNVKRHSDGKSLLLRDIESWKNKILKIPWTGKLRWL